MASRRGHGEGSIVRRPDGRWMGQIELGRGIDGKRRRKFVYAETEAEVVRKMKRLNGRAVNGQIVATSTPTVAVFLKQWFATNAEHWKPSTQRSYRGAIDGHLVPAFGPVRLEALTPQRLQAWITDHKTEHGARRRVELAHAVLRSALSEAVRLQVVATNAAMLVKLPRRTKRPIAPLDIDQAKAFLTAADKHRLGPLFSVALACGLRLGEATGLHWDDIDLETGDVRISRQLQVDRKKLVIQSLKTAASRRTLQLPDVCRAALKTHRTKQLEERLKSGPRWVDTGLVFTTYRTYKDGKGLGQKAGLPLHPRNVLRVLYALLDAADVPRRRFHDLRHSAGSILLARGVQLAEVSKLLGHSELRVTSDIYGHLMKQTAVKAAHHMDAVLSR